MCYTGLFKRIIPFVLTLAAGLFLASFFVSIALPGERWRNERQINKFNEIQQLRIENDGLRDKNRSLRLQIEELRKQSSGWDADAFMEDEVPPSDLGTYHPPKRPKHPRFGIER
jgi:cell division protein FtsB